MSVKKKYLTPMRIYSRMQKSGFNGRSDWGFIMEKIVEQGLLYDFYGELLTKHQRQIYEGIVYDNLSLGEIAQEEGISRQAVHDIVKRCDKTLQGYEEKLRLVARFNNIKDKVSRINRLSEQYENGELGDKAAYSMQVRQLSAEILQEL